MCQGLVGCICRLSNNDGGFLSLSLSPFGKVSRGKTRKTKLPLFFPTLFPRRASTQAVPVLDGHALRVLAHVRVCEPEFVVVVVVDEKLSKNRRTQLFLFRPRRDCPTFNKRLFLERRRRSRSSGGWRRKKIRRAEVFGPFRLFLTQPEISRLWVRPGKFVRPCSGSL